MEKETESKIETSSLRKPFVKGDIFDIDFGDVKGFAPELHRVASPKEWQEIREKSLKQKLP